MNDARILISCSSSDTVSGAELEEWLAASVAEFGPEDAAVHRAGPAEWRLELSGAAADSAHLVELMTDMRLLGLRPTVLRPTARPSRA